MMNKAVKETAFQCIRDNLVIRGVEYRMSGNKLPAIIVSHGFGGNSRHFTEFCQTFASWGYAGYTYDFCGGCANEEGQSDGSSLDMTIDTECEDLREVIRYVRSLPYIDADKVTLLGSSQGGLVSALVAARNQQDIRFENLILMSPALCIPDDARAGALAGVSYPIADIPDVIDCGKMQISRKFHENVVNMDVFHEIASYRGRVLILHGLEDQTVNYHYVIQAAETYGLDQCHLQLIRDAGHSFSPKQTISALVSIHQFLLRKQEILTIEVKITGKELREQKGTKRQSAVLFTGTSESKFFKGKILPGAADVQEYEGDQLISGKADYTLKGKDYAGKECSIHIVNQGVNGEWKPVIETDSEALEFLNRADLTAALEGYPGGLTVRVFSDLYNDCK